MAVTVGGTSITFNDGTVQSTAAGAVTTTQVLNATAGASVGGIGSYAFLRHLSFANRAPGTTAAGSQLLYSTGGGGLFSGSPSPLGTWRLMGQTGYDDVGSSGSTAPGNQVSLWLRIS